MHLHFTGSGHQLVEATGIVIIGHFSIDGQLKKDHCTSRHHNMVVVSGKEDLLEKLIVLLSYCGQTVLQLMPDEHDSSTYVCMHVHEITV